MPHRFILLLLTALALQAAAAPTYHNPLQLHLANGEPAANCADPAILRDPQAQQPTWYLYCTMDPVSRNERAAAGWRFRLMPIYRSTNLLDWQFVADAFTQRPVPAAPGAGLWAPEPRYFNGIYYLYYTITDVLDSYSPEPGCTTDSAIGVATSTSPAGPWLASSRPVVPPRRAGPGCNFEWTYDPDVTVDEAGQRYLYYGSYGGAVIVQPLSADGFTVTGQPRRIGADGRYEGAEVVWHDGAWFLFASATDCCAGPLTGYALHVGRSVSPLGPFLDRYGNDMAAPHAGGTPVLPQNGNRWVGAGHNTVFQDGGGQWWTIYHAVDVDRPYFAPGLTQRPALLDRLDWIGGWPAIAEGRGPSDETLPAPAVAPTDAALPPVRDNAHEPQAKLLWRETFPRKAFLRVPARPWHWLRKPGRWSAGPRGLAWSTQPGDLYVDTNTAPVLARPLPAGDVRIELRLRLDAPDACCATPAQAGFVVMADDDNFIKLAVLAYRGLHQVEFAKELKPVQPGYPRYGNTVAGTPALAGDWTWLRLDVVRTADGERYTAWSSRDGKHWVGGTAWNHRLGSAPRLGLVAMGGGRLPATFGEVRVSRLSH